MEILLKKTKVTKSIVEQLLPPDINKLDLYNVLGFCIFKKYKWILLYNDCSNDLRKLLWFNKIKLNDSTSIILDRGCTLRAETHIVDSPINLLNIFEDIKSKSLEKGQIFL